MLFHQAHSVNASDFKNYIPTLTKQTSPIKLKITKCSHSQLETIVSQLAAANLINRIIELDLSDNHLNHLPSLKIFTTLENINLDNNVLAEFPRQILACHTLKSVSIANNQLHLLSSIEKYLPHLEKLVLAGNPLTELRSKLNGLRYLDTRNTHLASLPNGTVNIETCTLRSLWHEQDYINENTKLLADDNSIRRLIPILQTPAYFDKDSLYRLELDPTSRFHLEDLKELFSLIEKRGLNDRIISFKCESIGLKSLPECISRCSQLRYLYLKNNKLSEVPKSVLALKSLRYCDLEGNDISALPSQLDQLENLEYFNLKNNSLKAIGPSLKDLTKIKYIDFSANHFDQIPEWFSQLNTLRGVSIEDHQLKTFPECLGDMTYLDVLNLGIGQSDKPTAFPGASVTWPKEVIMLFSDELRFKYQQFVDAWNMAKQQVREEAAEKLAQAELLTSTLASEHAERAVFTLTDNGSLDELTRILDSHRIKSSDSIALVMRQFDEARYAQLLDGLSRHELTGQVISLDLCENDLQSIPSIHQFENLRTLKLAHNKLSAPATLDSLHELKNLQELDLSDNQLTALPQAFSGTGVRQLWLNHNKLTDIEPLNQIKQCELLDLRCNKLTERPLMLPATLSILKLDDNPFLTIEALTETGNQFSTLIEALKPQEDTVREKSQADLLSEFSDMFKSFDRESLEQLASINDLTTPSTPLEGELADEFDMLIGAVKT